MLQALRRVPSDWPLTFGVALSATKTGAADYVVQMHVEKRKALDVRRSAVFVMWGAVYLGGVQYFIYSHLFPRVLFPSAAQFVTKPLSARLADRAGQADVIKQVVLDQFVHHPFVLFPCFYIVKEHVEQALAAPSADAVATALQKCSANWLADCKLCWQTWVPAFLFNFSVCPIHMRIPFVAVVSFGFTAVWSFRRGARQPLSDEHTSEG